MLAVDNGFAGALVLSSGGGAKVSFTVCRDLLRYLSIWTLMQGSRVATGVFLDKARSLPNYMSSSMSVDFTLYCFSPCHEVLNSAT